MRMLDYLLIELERAAADGDHGSKPILSESRPWPEDTSCNDLAPDDEDDSGTDRDQSTSNASRAPSKLERWKSDVLEGWFMNHLSRPYPVKKDKARLSRDLATCRDLLMHKLVGDKPHVVIDTIWFRELRAFDA